MTRRTAGILALAASCAALASCALPWKKEVPRAKAIRLPKPNASDGTKRIPRQVGTILMVSGEGNFVVIDTAGWVMPEAKAALKCLRAGAETGVVAVGSERKGNHVVADIVTGAPQKGDSVFE